MPITPALSRRLRLLALAFVLPCLGGCQAVLLAPSGSIAVEQRNLLLASTALMLLIIVPVMLLTAFFAWHYRASNTAATHDPDFHHSTGLEVVIWTVPLLIIVALGALTWMGTHLLDPYRPITRADAEPAAQSGTAPVKPAIADADSEPLVIQAVALDWKWLFLYPGEGIGAVNDLAIPLNRPIEFRITSTTVMNSLFIPALAGQIYAMPGMETKLHAILNEPGDFKGFSANYSGPGFSGMHFTMHGLQPADFAQWVAKAKTGTGELTRGSYTELSRPSENTPPALFARVDPDLFGLILNRCVDQTKMCQHEMMAIDARGGGGREGVWNVLASGHGTRETGAHAFTQTASYVAAICTPEDVTGRATPAGTVPVSKPD